MGFEGRGDPLQDHVSQIAANALTEPFSVFVQDFQSSSKFLPRKLGNPYFIGSIRFLPPSSLVFRLLQY